MRENIKQGDKVILKNSNPLHNETLADTVYLTLLALIVTSIYSNLSVQLHTLIKHKLQVMRIKKIISKDKMVLILKQILPTRTIRNIRRVVRRTWLLKMGKVRDLYYRF